MDCYVKVEEEGRRRLRRSEGKGEPSPFLLLMDREEWKQKRGDYLKGEEPLGGRGPSRCCKVEWVGDCLTGVLRVPEMEKASAFRLGMGFCLLPDRLVLIGEEGDVKGWVEGRLPALRQLQSPEHLLRELLEGLMGEDLLRLSRLEEKLEELEGSMEKADPNTFLRALARYRRKLSRLGAYYTHIDFGGLGSVFSSGNKDNCFMAYYHHTPYVVCSSSRWKISSTETLKYAARRRAVSRLAGFFSSSMLLMLFSHIPTAIARSDCFKRCSLRSFFRSFLTAI